jgi:ABC-type branched-subunit amino acid transport system substrate-binding protein
MGRGVRIASCVAVVVLVACGSRVVPLNVNAGGIPGQPGVNPTGGGPSINPTTGQTVGPGGTTGAGTTGAGGTTGPGVLPGCKAPANPTDKGVTKDTIKVGLVAAKGGSFRGQFNANIESVDAYFKMINAQGGICGRKIQLFVRDDSGNAQNDLQAAKELADDVGVFAFVGSVSAPDSDTGVASVSQQEKIPDIGFPLTYERSESPFSYGVPGQLQKRLIGEGASGSRYLDKLYGIKQIAVFWVSEALVSKANAWAFEAAILKTGGPDMKICYDRETSVLDNNFDSYAVSMAGACPTSKGPLAVYTTMENNSNIKLAQAMRSQHVPVKVFDPTFTSYLPSFVRDDSGNPRPETEGAYMALPQIPFERCAVDSRNRPVPPCSHPELNKYVTALTHYVPGFSSPGSWGGPGWGEAALFVQGVEGCGANLTRRCVLDQINKINSFTVNGFLSPSTPRVHKIYTADLLMRIHNGRFVEVNPSDKSGPKEAPDFWDTSDLMDWWNFFCANKSRFTNTYRNEIDSFVTSC